ncbi:MAG: hypothetical protein HYV42_03655 [Candidatus Magasanikbacteria bacterium]|nr:hypothetical protein [Candidatus Magasanikbacteria bacterium]
MKRNIRPEMATALGELQAKERAARRQEGMAKESQAMNALKEDLLKRFGVARESELEARYIGPGGTREWQSVLAIDGHGEVQTANPLIGKQPGRRTGSSVKVNLRGSGVEFRKREVAAP